MRAAVRDNFGPPEVVEIREIEKPRPADDEVLVQVRAASVNMADWYDLTGTPYVGRAQMGLRKPKSERLGVDFAGVVEGVGRDVTQFRPGDEVFGGRNGAFAEYVARQGGSSDRAEAGRRDVRAGGGRSHRGDHRACRAFATRGSSSRGRRS